MFRIVKEIRNINDIFKHEKLVIKICSSEQASIRNFKFALPFTTASYYTEIQPSNELYLLTHAGKQGNCIISTPMTFLSHGFTAITPNL